MARCFIVTGGAGALGSAVAKDLIARGHNVVLVDVPQASARLDSLAKELGDSARGIPLDVGSEDAWKGALAGIESSLGPVFGAVLVAGGWQGGAPLHSADSGAAYHAMVSRNLETAHATLRAVLPGLVSRGGGSVVVVGSRAVERPWESAGAAAYAASKAAVVALAQAAAAEVLESGVRVNAVLPSTMDTAANRAAMPQADPTRWVSTQSMAGVIAFLLSDESRDISGAAIPVYGRA